MDYLDTDFIREMYREDEKEYYKQINDPYYEPDEEYNTSRFYENEDDYDLDDESDCVLD